MNFLGLLKLMVQKINPHPAPGCNRSPPYHVFSKDAIRGSVSSISSEVLAWWARTCWKTTWIAEIGKARIITGGCFLLFSRCFCYNFSLQNKGVLWSLEIYKKVIHYQIMIHGWFSVRKYTLYESFWDYM